MFRRRIESSLCAGERSCQRSEKAEPFVKVVDLARHYFVRRERLVRRGRTLLNLIPLAQTHPRGRYV
jgi:hypothetical protein